MLKRCFTARILISAGLVTLTLSPMSALPASANWPAAFAAFCSRVLTTNVGPYPLNAIGVSSGAEMVCNPPSGSVVSVGTTTSGTSTTSASSETSSGGTKNVDAASLSEDVTPSGARVYGQSEVSIAAASAFVVEGWNDATGFFVPCGATTNFKEELTGLGFSSNGGASFTDLGGLPNDTCSSGFMYFGDPTVEAYQAGGNTYFYVASLYINVNTGQSDIAMDACQASGTTLTCNATPIVIATGAPGDFLDKEFMTVDPQRARLYVSYTRFGLPGSATANGQIELAKCDISSPLSPSCNPGASPASYIVVAPGNSCQNQGSYPAADVATGDVYVGWEFNWVSNFDGMCPVTPTQDKVARVTFACASTGACTPMNTASVSITSMDLAFIPGYNRFPPNDFPRIAVSDPYSTVSIVWNDARVHPLGDIFMQSYSLGTLAPVQTTPVPLDSLSQGGMHFLPALRNASSSGKLNVSFFTRSDPNTTLTDVFANTNVVPIITSASSQNTRVTNVQSDWNAVSSDIIPNFGDYTDNFVIATPTAPYTDKTLYITWSDGRLGVPNPFVAHVSGS